MVAQPVPSYLSGKNPNHHVKNNGLSHRQGVDLEALPVYWGVSGQFLSDSLVTNATTGERLLRDSADSQIRIHSATTTTFTPPFDNLDAAQSVMP